LPLVSNSLPVPYIQYSDGSYAILYPNSEGFLELKYGVTFYLSCTESRFEFQPRNTQRIDLQVTCHDGELVTMFNGISYESYDFRSFLCMGTPKSDVEISYQECKGPNTVVAKVGFRTQFTFLPQYGICFDTLEINSLYSWYEARMPNKNLNFDYGSQPPFLNCSQLYSDIDVNKAYSIKSQVSIII